MRRLLTAALIFAACLAAAAAQRQQPKEQTWTSEFRLEPGELVSSGRNPYFSLEPGDRSVLEAGDERLVVTVLEETREIDGVQTRVVEERETRGGALIEVSRNFYAFSRRTGCVFYFGEEVDIYRGGRVVAHEGAWLAGEGGARFGLMMPGVPLLGARYYQEFAPRVAMDRAEIVSLGETVRTPAGEFRNALKIAETNPLEPGAREYKYYAPGVGLIQDGSLKLVKSGKAD